MGLTFPNESRSFDDARNVIRFTGYDDMFEVKFFVEAAALVKAAGTEISEAECLRAFDAARSEIQKTATKLYSRKRGSVYKLTAADLS